MAIFKPKAVVISSFFLTNDGQVRTSITDATDAVKKGGNISVNASDTLELSNGGRLLAQTSGSGNAGNITIDTNKLHIRFRYKQFDPSQITGIGTDTFSESSGDGGNLTINATESVTISGNNDAPSNPSPSEESVILAVSTRTGLTASTLGSGKAGNLTINTKRLTITNRAGAATASISRKEDAGDGGVLTVTATESIELQNLAGLAATTVGFGNAGNLIVNAGQINLTGGAVFSTDTFGSGKGGDLIIKTNELKILSGSRVGATTVGEGKGGTVKVNTPENKAQLVQIDGVSANGEARSGIFSDSRASGNAGNIEMFADILDIQNRGEVSVSSFSSGFSGNMNINADQITLQKEASIGADTFDSGKGGDLTINTANLSIMSGSRIGTETFGTGNGGTAQVTAREKIIIDGISSTNNEVRSSLTANSQEGGEAGNLNINTKDLQVLNGGQIAVSSTGKGVSGDMIVTADSIFLNNQASINALTEFTQGGDINITVTNDINFEGRDSEISSEALLEDASGGKLNIESGGFIISSGVPNNNDVVVTAGGKGKGGDISVTAEGIFGFVNFNQFRTPDSDFSAVSRLGQNGNLSLITNNPEPQLPQQPNVREIVQVCPSSQGVTTRAAGRSEYINTGHGGLPPNPNEALESNTAQVPWVTLKPQENKPTTTSKPKVIREAQGWMKMPNGKLLLTTKKSNSSSSSCVFQSR